MSVLIAVRDQLWRLLHPGIVTGVLMGIYACARILTGCSRERMLPPFIALVGRKQTPWVATWIIGICTAVIGLMTPFAEL
jgi:APA family basic amino acid/polyamine antiporter